MGTLQPYLVQQDAKTSGVSHLVKLSLPIYKQFVSRVITRTRKPRKMVGNFPVREKSENFEQTAKVRKITQNTGKVWEFQTNVIYYFLNCVLFWLKWIKFSRKKNKNGKAMLEKWKKKYWKCLEKGIDTCQLQEYVNCAHSEP